MLEEWILGQCYFVVVCHACEMQFPFARAETKLPSCPLRLTCCVCYKTDYYCPKEFLTVEAK